MVSTDRLELSTIHDYSDPVIFDAERTMGEIGDRLLMRMYNSSYTVGHVVELNAYYQWLEAILVEFIPDPQPFLDARAHGFSYFSAPHTRDKLMQYVLHTPHRADSSLLRFIKAGLKKMLLLSRRHQAEHLSGGKLDLEKISSGLRRIVWTKLEAHPIDKMIVSVTLTHMLPRQEHSSNAVGC